MKLYHSIFSCVVRRLLCIPLCIALISIIGIQPAAAWNKAGHMMTAAIAYDTLKKDNPTALDKVLALLRQHPQYDKMWAKQIERVAPEDRDQALFMLAARWPDDIRDDPDYNQPSWHYTDIPFKPVGQPDSVVTVNPPEPNIETAFRQNVNVVQERKSTDGERAVALCWIFHLIGDVHQPLHTVSLFTTDFPGPKGDQGGTKMFIRAKPDADPINLHKFWDDLLGSDDDTREVKKKAIEFRTEFPQAQVDPQSRNVTANDFPKWIQESLQSAKNDVYRQGKFAGSPRKDDAPALPDGYIKQVQPVAQRRATLAGYRLADVLGKL
jgi:S1/P1 Nuclease